MQILPMTLRSGEIRARQDTLLSTEVIKKKSGIPFGGRRNIFISPHIHDSVGEEVCDC